jgi:hypothetical protein
VLPQRRQRRQRLGREDGAGVLLHPVEQLGDELPHLVQIDRRLLVARRPLRERLLAGGSFRFSGRLRRRRRFFTMVKEPFCPGLPGCGKPAATPRRVDLAHARQSPIQGPLAVGSAAVVLVPLAADEAGAAEEPVDLRAVRARPERQHAAEGQVSLALRAVLPHLGPAPAP